MAVEVDRNVPRPALRDARGVGAQYEMMLHCREAPACGRGASLFFCGGRLNVCRENNLGNSSDRRFHNVYLTVLFSYIDRGLFGAADVLPEAV